MQSVAGRSNEASEVLRLAATMSGCRFSPLERESKEHMSSRNPASVSHSEVAKHIASESTCDRGRRGETQVCASVKI